jgi:hypothetical protein
VHCPVVTIKLHNTIAIIAGRKESRQISSLQHFLFIFPLVRNLLLNKLHVNDSFEEVMKQLVIYFASLLFCSDSTI